MTTIDVGTSERAHSSPKKRLEMFATHRAPRQPAGRGRALKALRLCSVLAVAGSLVAMLAGGLSACERAEPTRRNPAGRDVKAPGHVRDGAVPRPTPSPDAGSRASSSGADENRRARLVEVELPTGFRSLYWLHPGSWILPIHHPYSWLLISHPTGRYFPVGADDDLATTIEYPGGPSLAVDLQQDAIRVNGSPAGVALQGTSEGRSLELLGQHRSVAQVIRMAGPVRLSPPLLERLSRLDRSDLILDLRGLEAPLADLERLKTLSSRIKGVALGNVATETAIYHLRSLRDLQWLSSESPLDWLRPSAAPFLSRMTRLTHLDGVFPYVLKETSRSEYLTSLRRLEWLSQDTVALFGPERFLVDSLRMAEQLRYLQLESSVKEGFGTETTHGIQHVSIESLGSLTRLETLSIGGVLASAVHTVAGRTSLRALQMWGYFTGYTAASILELSRLKGLVVLDLVVTPLDDEQRARLLEYPDLEALVLRDELKPPFDRTFERLARLPRLRHLSLWLMKDASAGRALANLGQLRWLELQLDATSAPAALVGILGMSRLSNLRLSGHRLVDRDLVALGKLERLEQLDLDSADLGVAGLEALARLPQLRVLSIGRGQVVGGSLAALGRAVKLKALVLPGMAVSREDLDALGKLTSLRYLKVDASRLDRTSLRSLVGLAELRALSLRRLADPTPDLSPLAGLPRLRVLELSGASFPVEAIAGLAGSSSLRLIRWIGPSPGPAGRAALRRALPDCRLVHQEWEF